MAQQRVLVVDSSKFGKVRSACMGPLASFDLIISDEKPDAAFVEFAASENIQIEW
ncbi:Deoxyribose operon repressor [compost metagenome]